MITDMKRLFVLFALCALTIVSCKEVDNTTPTPPAPEIDFQITSENPVEVEAEGGAIVIEYAITNPKDGVAVNSTTNVDWIVASDATYAGHNELFYTVLPNETTEPRSATIIVSYDTFTADVVVNQAAKSVDPYAPEFILTSPNPVLAVAEGGWYYFQFELLNRVDDILLNVDCEADWIENIGANEDIIYFDVARNETGEPRTATLTAIYGDLRVELIVEQAGDFEKMPYLSGVYFGNDYGATENDYNYSLVLSSRVHALDIITGEANIVEGHKYLFIDLYSSVPSENYNINFTVPQGEYLFDNEDSAVAGTVGARFTSYFDATGSEGVEVFFVSGKVVVSENRIEANFIGEDGKEYVFYTDQTYIDNMPYFVGSGQMGDFTTLTSDLEIPFTSPSLYAEGYGDYYIIGKDLWVISIDDYSGTWHNLVVEVLVPMGTDIPEGEFIVSSDLSLEQMMLPGFVNSYGDTMWSWYFEREGYDVIGKAQIVDGKMTITDNGDGTHTANINFVDTLGHTISGECTAEFEIFGNVRSISSSQRFTRPVRK